MAVWDDGGRTAGPDTVRAASGGGVPLLRAPWGILVGDPSVTVIKEMLTRRTGFSLSPSG